MTRVEVHAGDPSLHFLPIRGPLQATEDQGGDRRDWRDSVAAASDLALIGIVATVAALPGLTAGAAVAGASAAVHEWCATERLVPPGRALRRLRSGLLPGLGAALVGVPVTALLLFNALALARGRVPGGTPLLVATAVLVVLWAGFAGLTVVEVGRRSGAGWRDAARSAGAASLARPWVPVVLGLVVGLTGLLAALLPFLTPVLFGYGLFALHVTAARLGA